ncbi:DUF368 domain-containing protein [Rothia endophytica]|uniref:DUF368 domain-containing protein n=1 Tax=Rothia endophytica TaxID=1324766 RepID=UPI001F3F607B|nr:DUF368 domain-containing protein [Rothia endophytica]
MSQPITEATATKPTATKDTAPSQIALNLVRGALIGTVETVPGVSGGTVALVVGVYERLIGAASSLMSGVKEVAVGTVRKDSAQRSAGFQRIKNLPWALLLAIFLGMGVAVVSMAHMMSYLVEDQPVLTSAAFFGMVLASLYVPYNLAGKWRGKDWLYALVAAVIMYFIVSMPPAGDMSNPPWFLIMGAAAVAIAALVLPGLSGSFLLLSFGLYHSTMSAISTFDLTYITLFGLGAVLGLATVVKGLEWVLEHHHHITLVVLTGVMLGALRALWPWKTDTNDLLAVGDQAGAALIWCLVGFALVALVILADKIFNKPKVVHQETI